MTSALHRKPRRALTLAALGALGALAALGAAAPAQTLDPEAVRRGERYFRACQACHAVNTAANRTGPTLKGVVNRPAGAVEGFRYSKAMASSGVVWTRAALIAYLQDPRGFAPGTTMAFRGVRTPELAADLVAYLEAAGRDD